ncbi:MAG: TonB-dependent receptor, partial [candidate division Zixibacteria bacterium]|nr:TonB-dependent receptor [candidate division Zixibacteria bacterium]
SYDRWQEYRHYYLNPDFIQQVEHSPVYEDKNLGLNAKVTHTLNANTFYNLSVSYFNTSRLRGDGKIFDEYSLYERSITNPEYDRHNLFREGNIVYASDVDSTIHVGDPDDTVVQYVDSYWDNYLKRQSWYGGVKGDFTSQVNSHNTLKMGFDFQRHTVRRFENLQPSQGDLAERVNRFGYDENAESTDDLNWWNETRHPINLGIYVQDRFEFRGLIVNAGLRFDYFDYKALRLRNPDLPFDPDSLGYDTDLTNDSETETLELSDLEDSEKFTRLSPRLGISFPVSDRSQMHINYGIFYQRPDLQRLFAGYDFLEARIGAGSYYPFPSPNLEPETITQYEAGITQQLGDNVAFDITAYYKDVKDMTQIFHQAAQPYSYDYYANIDYGTIKGVDFSLTMRRTRNLSMNLKYSLSYANGTGSYANSTTNIAWKNPEGAPKVTNPLDFDQRHSIIGIFDIRSRENEGPKIGNVHVLENMGLNVVTQIASGTPYTEAQVYDAVSPNASVSQVPLSSINNAHLPWQFVIDLKLERTLTYAGYKFVPYIWVRNLLDKDNVVGVYEGTGEANRSGYLESPEGQLKAASTATDQHTGVNYGDQFAYRYDLAQNNPKNYANPRMILVGMRVSF